MSLINHLLENGYYQIPLKRSGVGHFHAEAMLNNKPITVLLDTGAGATLVNIHQADAYGLMLVKTAIKAGGAGGGGLDIYQVSNATLSLGELTLPNPTLMAMDLKHVNDALKLKGEAPVDLIIGVNVFDAHSAVIDYGSQNLFLKS